jgi:hypothetical protein
LEYPIEGGGVNATTVHQRPEQRVTQMSLFWLHQSPPIVPPAQVDDAAVPNGAQLQNPPLVVGAEVLDGACLGVAGKRALGAGSGERIGGKG